MRLRQLRITVRGMMVSVAIAAIALGLVARSRRFYRMALYHDARTISTGLEKDGVRLPGGFDDYSEPVSQEANDWHHVMAVKYEWAARHPWLPVGPDPPEPIDPPEQN
jgi:hypothetical protein